MDFQDELNELMDNFADINYSQNENKVLHEQHDRTAMTHTIPLNCDSEIESMLENVSQVISAAEEPLILAKDSSCNEKIKLSGYHLGTRKGTRSVLMNQNSKDMDRFLHELLKDIDKRVTPKIKDDDIGGKWMQSIYCPGIYNIKCLVFHLSPNRSLDYLEGLKEIPNYTSKCMINHKILAAVLDATCINGNACTYKTVFYPHVDKPGPLFMPEYVRELLEYERHGLTLSSAVGLVDLLCSFFAPVIDQLDLKNDAGEKITSSSMEYQSDMILEKSYDFDQIKWAHNLCICCVFMKQAKISLQACSGNWIINDSSGEETDPIERITLLGYEPYVDHDVKTSINCFSNVININDYKMTSFINFPFSFYEVRQVEGFGNLPCHFEVVRK